MTWEELQEKIGEMNERQLKSDIFVAPVNTDRYSPIVGFEWTDCSTHEPDTDNPYLVVDP